MRGIVVQMTTNPQRIHQRKLFLSVKAIKIQNNIDYLKIQQDEKEDYKKIIKLRLQNLDKGMSLVRISHYHKDSGKTKTSILLNHLKKENLQKSLIVTDKNLIKKFKKILSEFN